MKLLKKIFIGLLVLIGFALIKSYQPSLLAVYPKQCAFLMDDQLSPEYKLQLQKYIEQEYQNCKNPEQVVDAAAKEFNEVVAIDAYVCKTDKLCFSVTATKPLFLFNEDSVVCDNALISDKSHFHSDLINSLYAVTANHYSSMDQVISFMKTVPKSTLQQFNVFWNSDEEIFFKTKNEKNGSLLFSKHSASIEEDVMLFEKMKQGLQKKRGNKGKIYDFRFHSQVVIR